MGGKINKQLVLWTVIVIFALYLFKGMLYVSDNGWILLKYIVSLDARVKETYEYDTCYDMVFNGEPMTMIAYRDTNRENYTDFPAEAPFRFSLLTKSYGIVEFSAMKKDGKVECTLIDPVYISYQLEQQLDEVYEMLAVIEDFILEFWKGNGMVLIDNDYINEGRLTGMLISLCSVIIVQSLLYYNGRKGKINSSGIYYVGWLAQSIPVLINMSNYVVII